MDKRLTYNSVEELASDDTFIQWVQSKGNNQSNFWVSWESENPDKTELMSEAKSLVLSLNFKDSSADKQIEDKIWAEVDRSTKDPKSGESDFRSVLKYLATTAAILILFFVFKFTFPETTVIESERAEKITHTLPDQSIVQLNAESSIHYKDRNWDNNRSLELEGEAFFEVESGSNFDVQTSSGTVQVIGTSFNIYDREDQFEVSCITGMVRVIEKKSGDELILSQGERVKLVNGSFLKEASSAAIGIDWLRDEYWFKDAALTEVFKELERQFDVNIDLEESISSLRYTGSFTTSNLDSALYSICWPMRISSEIKGQTIIVKK